MYRYFAYLLPKERTVDLHQNHVASFSFSPFAASSGKTACIYSLYIPLLCACR